MDLHSAFGFMVICVTNLEFKAWSYFIFGFLALSGFLTVVKAVILALANPESSTVSQSYIMCTKHDMMFSTEGPSLETHLKTIPTNFTVIFSHSHRLHFVLRFR